jgi:hypothetical protein
MASKKKRGLGKSLEELLNPDSPPRPNKWLDELLEGAYRYDEREKARRDREFDIYDTPRSRKAIEYLEGEERRAAEDREADEREEEARKKTDEDVAPEETEDDSLPTPEYIDFISQASGFGIGKPYPRPDLHPIFYNEGPDKSTRVHAMQFIPTSKGTDQVTPFASQLLPAMGYSKQFGVVGDILVAFARPSKGKSTLFIYKNQTGMQWLGLKNATSLGKRIKTLGSAEPYSPSMGARYKELHKNTMDGGSLYDNWIFNEDQLARWMVIRPDNER